MEDKAGTTYRQFLYFEMSLIPDELALDLYFGSHLP